MERHIYDKKGKNIVHNIRLECEKLNYNITNHKAGILSYIHNIIYIRHSIIAGIIQYPRMKKDGEYFL